MTSTLEKIGRYQIAAELGRGAMGVVYRAVDPNIGRTVALKTMRLDVHGLQRNEMLMRFKNEARAAGAMNHPNIVTIHDADEADGLFYIAMECLDGETLESVMLRTRILPAEQIVDITRQVAAGLDYAHATKVIHRDIKPANIMFTRQNVAKIMDFGISKSVGNLTSSSQVLGTPNYMSPEQVRGLTLDGRSDLFSFGVVLYEMATGRRPFEGESVTAVIYKIVHETPLPASDLEMTVHPGLSAVISRCLAKNPNERYQSGGELVHDIENFRSICLPDNVTAVLPATIDVEEAQTMAKAATSQPVPASARLVASQIVPSAAAVPVAVIPKAAKQPTSVTEPQIVRAEPESRKTKTATWATVAVLAFAAGAATLSLRPHWNAPVSLETREPKASSVVATTMPDKHAGDGGAVRDNKKEEIKKTVPTSIPATGNSPARAGAVEIRNSAWVTPFTMPGLIPGNHEVVFSKPSYTAEKRSLQIGLKKDTYGIDLVTASTAISASSDPPGASIEIDGRDSGRVTPAKIPVGEGQHTIVMRMAGYRPAGVSANIEVGQIYNLSQHLIPIPGQEAGSIVPTTVGHRNVLEPSIPQGMGVIDFVTNPSGANIFIQGKPANRSTPAHNFFPPGDYSIGLRLPGYKLVQQSVHVEAGTTFRVDVNLDPE